MKIFKSFTFDAAHRLTNAPEGHKCSRIHGHTFKLEIHVSGQVDEQRGWIVDFADMCISLVELVGDFGGGKVSLVFQLSRSAEGAGHPATGLG